MPIMINVTLRGVPIEVFDEVNREVLGSGAPPTGLVAHFVHNVGDGDVRVVDVWMSEEDHDAHDDAVDPPEALARVLKRRGLGPAQLVGREIVEVVSLVRGLELTDRESLTTISLLAPPTSCVGQRQTDPDVPVARITSEPGTHPVFT